MYILNMVDTSVGGFPLLFAGVFECVAVNFVYGKYFYGFFNLHSNQTLICLSQDEKFTLSYLIDELGNHIILHLRLNMCLEFIPDLITECLFLCEGLNTSGLQAL